MAKDNLFLGFARGSVGDVTFTHIDGTQIARARNRAPKNPRTPLQLLQRVLLKTTSSAYSMLQELCNHSFQGYAEGTMSQARFNKLNIEYFRQLLWFEINSGEAEDILNSGYSNFASRGSSQVEINPYIISEGSITTLPISWFGSAGTPRFGIDVSLGSATPTYQDVVDSLGLVRGDQLTFLSLSVDDTQEVGVFNGFEFCRVILDPSTGDMTQPFLNGSSVNLPNEKNKGSFTFSVQQVSGSYKLTFISSSHVSAAGNVASVCAGTVIVSRSSGDVWQRSRQSLVVRPDTIGTAGALNLNHSIDFLGDAVASYMDTSNSGLYLNQAGAASGITPPAGPALFTSVKMNGHELDPDAPNQSVPPVTLVATMVGGDAAKTYKLALYTYAGGNPGTKVTEAAFVSGSATISNQSVQVGNYIACLLEDGQIVDSSPDFSLTND